ncbi:uncharacterized protein [Zea mays]|uniref:uncharacterized protein n=1 Tax=Zea mays TaxID=4577 RepID=UPI0009A951E2|nr:uncharacterized protein LOC109943703 [Zea mays]|eukprot:XP_020402788.1 uncharacterized protein LOC109943703 [Zea mays]
MRSDPHGRAPTTRIPMVDNRCCTFLEILMTMVAAAPSWRSSFPSSSRRSSSSFDSAAVVFAFSSGNTWQRNHEPSANLLQDLIWTSVVFSILGKLLESFLLIFMLTVVLL